MARLYLLLAMFIDTIVVCTAVKLTKDYFDQRAQGREPILHGAEYPEQADEVDHEIWWRR